MLDGIARFYDSHEALLYSLFGLSLFTFILTLLAVPWLILRLPHDYFARHERPPVPRKQEHPLLRVAFLVGKNLLGCLFVLMGIAMLVLPGQGLLTLMIGIVLLDFPGKYQVERWLVCRPPIHRSVNWLRRRFHRAPLVL